MFYRCPHCGNIVCFMNKSGVPVICCGEPMQEMAANTSDGATEKHVPAVKVEICTVDGEVKKKKVKVEVGELEHPMTDEHYIQWIFIQCKKSGQFKVLQPGDKPKAKFIIRKDEPVAVYEYCNIHGLWKKEL